MQCPDDIIVRHRFSLKSALIYSVRCHTQPHTTFLTQKNINHIPKSLSHNLASKYNLELVTTSRPHLEEVKRATTVTVKDFKPHYIVSYCLHSSSAEKANAALITGPTDLSNHRSPSPNLEKHVLGQTN